MITLRHSIAILLTTAFGIALPLHAADARKPVPGVTSEPFGKLALGQSAAEVVKLLGKPESKGREMLQEADGTRVQDWQYPTGGLTLVMQSLKQNGVQKVFMIRAKAPCSLVTARGIAIGSTEAAATKAYAKERDRGNSKTGKSLLAGSLYDGVEFTFTRGKVSEIVIGVTAE